MMRKTISLLIFCFMVGIPLLTAQKPIIQSPTSGDYAEWSVDSQIFAYRNDSKNFPQSHSTNSDVFLEHPYWEAFNPDNGDWFENTIWPLYPNLSEAEKKVFQTEGFTRISPDGQILVYPSLDEKLTLANRSTQEIFKTEIDYFVYDSEKPIRWSEDSQGFAVEGAGPSVYTFQPIDYYIRLRDPRKLSQTELYSVQWNEFMSVGGRKFSPILQERILDVHHHQVLTTMSDLTVFGNADVSADLVQSYLVIWSPENPEKSVIIDAFNGNSVQVAAFVPNDPQRMLVMLGNGNIGGHLSGQAGLYLYDMKSKEIQYLASFDGYYDYPYFSPDGNWLAFKSSENFKFAFFSTRELMGVTPLSFSTAFPTFTPVPTYTPTPTP